MDQPTSSIRFVVHSVSYILRPVLPYLEASSVPLVVLVPLSAVNGFIVEQHGLSVGKLFLVE